MEDPEAIKQMLDLPESEWAKTGPPPLFGWSNVIDRLTDLGDQLIAQRAQDSKKVRFYPRPKIPAAALRTKQKGEKRDSRIEEAQRKNRERRGLTT